LDAREMLLAGGYRRLLVRGEARDIDEVKPSDAVGAAGGLEVVIDRVRVDARDARRLGAAIEEAWRASGGEAAIVLQNGQKNGSNGEHVRLKIARGLTCGNCARRFDP